MTQTLPDAAATCAPLSDDDLGVLLLIRHFERRLLDLFERGELNGTTHTCLGQEYVPVALRTLLRRDDYVFSNHRGHGHYLARFPDPRPLLAEIMGRDGAVCRGVGGSQHILAARYLSTGVQGQSMPVGAGVALALKHAEPGTLACVHIGDGTWGEGAVYEALNMAALWRLPLLVVVEHNGIAQSTPTAVQMAGTVATRSEAFGVRHHRVDTVDVAGIREEIAPLVADVRAGPAPLVLEFATHRIGPHSKGDDTRSPSVIDDARSHDWYGLYADLFPEQVAAVERDVVARLDDVVDDVVAAPLSTWEEGP